ncbi:DUF6668 family protein [Nocardia sp. CNY236]|uniref:DUF6668 family protein n=1 Tax=Nocardia sp. CNY236 TaxID=1169152 RepID=UPI000414A8F7|nr:DUF6668 family protein [Nocardia sp. CNY236]
MSAETMKILTRSVGLGPRGGRKRVRPRSARTVVAPPPAQRAAVWDRPVPVPHNAIPGGAPPLVWLLGAHGGAGATTLQRLLAPAAECHRRWPAPAERESPYVVVVARAAVVGLSAADALLRQHHAGLAGDSTVVGLVTVAARPGRLPAQIRRDRALYSGLVEHVWHVDWHEAWMLSGHDALPVWSPGEHSPGASHHRDELASPPADIRSMGRELVDAITTLHYSHTSGERS